MKELLKIFFIITGFLFSLTSFSQTKYYVKPGGTGTGGTWDAAAGDLQAVINLAVAGDEIWVAAGSYTPSGFPGASGTLTARDVSFVLKSGVKVYGGFAGTESALDQRNFENNVSILSGDIGTPGQNSDNAHHVVISVKNTPGTLLDGFVITDGNADASGFVTVDAININRQSGGGVYANSSQTVFKNVIIRNNRCAGGDDFFGNGGGVYSAVSQLTIENSEISENASERVPEKSGGTSGAIFAFGVESARASLTLNNVVIERNTAMNLAGAVYISSYTDAEFTDVHFLQNTAAGSGGALRVDGSSASNFNNFKMEGGSFVENSAVGAGGAAYIWSFTNYQFNRVYFSGNEATSAGGALFLFSGGGVAAPNDDAKISNSAFYNNKSNAATLGGGAIFVSNGTQVQISNSTFYANYAKFGGGAIGVFSNAVVKADIDNSIFYANTTDGSNPDFYVGPLATSTLSHSVTQEQGNDGVNGVRVNVDPLFASTDPNSEYFLRLLKASPAVDAGDNNKIANGTTTDLSGKERIVNDVVDMGAYEFVDEGGPTLSQTLTFASDVTKTYGDDKFVPVATASSGLPVSYSVGDTTVAVVVDNEIIIRAAGTTSITASQAGNFEYLPADSVTRVLTINKAELSIRPVDTTMIQGDPLPVFRISYTGFVYDDDESDLTTMPQVSTTATSSSPDGEYPVTVAGAVSNNYNIQYEEGKLSIMTVYPEGVIRYVKPVASGSGSGLSWADASDDIQAMIEASSPGGEVWVAQGTYVPNSLPGLAEAPDSRDVAFVLKSGVGVYGGFTGNEVRKSDRDVMNNKTTLSGDAGVQGSNADNAYHVVISVNNTGNTVLDGFTITNGYAGGSGSYTVNGVTVQKNSGAGIFVEGSEASFNNLIVTGNTISGSGQGAGVYLKSNSNVKISNSEISSNNVSGSTAMGGGIFALGELNAINYSSFSNVVIKDNTSEKTGGAAYLRYYTSTTFEDADFDNNAATEAAGIHTVGQADLTTVIKITRANFRNHHAKPTGNGGAMLVAQYVSLELDDCEFSNNSAGYQGGAIYITGNMARFNRLVVNNSRFLENKLLASTANGGALRIANYVDAWITNSYFAGNEALGGGAVSLAGSSYAPSENLHFTNCIFYANKSTTTSSASGGGAIAAGVYLTTNIVNCTFYRNEALNVGGAVNPGSHSFIFVNVYNSVFSENTATTGKDMSWPTNSNVVLKNNLTQEAGVHGEEGMIVGESPQFESVVPTDNNFLHLSVLSPAVNKGDNSLVPAEIMTDYAGKSRIIYTTVDMGAFEYDGPPLNPTDAQTITFSGDIVKTYGDPLFDPGAIASSGLPVSYIISNTSVARLGSNNTIQLTGSGVTEIRAYQPGNAQYLPSDTVTVTLTVNKAPLIIRPADTNMEEGTDLPIFTATYTGFVYNDNEAALTIPPIITTTATRASPIGTYPLIASGAQSDKYEITYEQGLLSIIEPQRFPAERINMEVWFSSSTEMQVTVDMVTEQNGSLVVYDNVGIPVYSIHVLLKIGTNKFTIPANRMLPGVYIVNVRGSGFKLDKKIIKR